MTKKLRIYLDTNIILGWFKAKIQEQRGKEFFIPERLISLQNRNYVLFVSTLVKIEIYRYLKSDWQLDKKMMNFLWDNFKREFTVDEIELPKFQVDMIKILDITCEIALKKADIVDLVHIQISEENNLKFLTDESDLKNKLSKFYKNIITLEYL